MVHLSARSKGLAERFEAGGNDHELLEVRRVEGVLAAVDDVEQWHWEDELVAVREQPIEGHPIAPRDGAGECEGHAKNRIAPKPGLVTCAVHLDHRAVQRFLIKIVAAEQLRPDFAAYALDCPVNTLTPEARFIAVPQFHGLSPACARARGHRSTAHGSVSERYVHFNRGDAARVEYLASVYIRNLCQMLVAPVLCFASSLTFGHDGRPA